MISRPLLYGRKHVQHEQQPGMVILELVGDKEKHGELYNTLKKASCVSVDIQMMTIENC